MRSKRLTMSNYLVRLKNGASIPVFGSWYEFNKKDGVLNVISYDMNDDAEDLTFTADLDNVEYIICTEIQKVEIFNRP